MLCAELKGRHHYVEGNAIADKFLYPVRMTLLVGLMSVYGLWRKLKKITVDDYDDFVHSFCVRDRQRLILWGKGSDTSISCSFLVLKATGGSNESDRIIMGLINSIVKTNSPDSLNGIASPYHDIDSIIPNQLGIQSDDEQDDFQGSAYTLEGLLYLMVRRNWKRFIKVVWPDITRISFNSFIPQDMWQNYLWCSEHGVNRAKIPPLTKNWIDLCHEARKLMIISLIILKMNCILLLLFLIVYPHGTEQI